MFFAYPALIADRKHAYAYVHPDGAMIHRAGDVSLPGAGRYRRFDGPLPKELREAVERYPGPCKYLGRHCDSVACAEPLTARPERLSGLPWRDDAYAANAEAIAAEEAAAAEAECERQARRAAEIAAVDAWYAANRDRLIADYVSSRETSGWDNGVTAGRYSDSAWRRILGSFGADYAPQAMVAWFRNGSRDSVVSRYLREEAAAVKLTTDAQVWHAGNGLARQFEQDGEQAFIAAASRIITRASEGVTA